MNRFKKITLFLSLLIIVGLSLIATADSVIDTSQNGIKIKILREKATLRKTEEIILKEWNDIDEFNQEGYYYLIGDIAHIKIKDLDKLKKLSELNKEIGMISNINIEKSNSSMEELESDKSDLEEMIKDMDIVVYGIDIDYKREKVVLKTPEIKEDEKNLLENKFQDRIKVISKYDEEDKKIEDKEFIDLVSSHWAYDSIKYLQQKGVASGNEDNTFRPEEHIMREDAMKLAYKAIGSISIYRSIPELSKVFIDQNDVSVYAEKSIRYFDGINVINGYPDGTIRPKENINRAEAITFLANAFSFKLYKDQELDNLNYYDVSEEDYYYKSLQKLKKIGAIKDSQYFRPFDYITRAEFAYILYSICNN